MKCPRPNCDSVGQILDTRVRPDGVKRRRYRCAHGHRFSTIEQVAERDTTAQGQTLRVKAAR